ncbi:UNVERIFIED_CONTAM: hypothetical protein PYX00_005673 [Menopon gallinae]|uniref:ZP domain-containing protein n=1 Tax=Menopon gallinae TaxID=328185 RepID=A0AAW2HSC9_9NEOP
MSCLKDLPLVAAQLLRSADEIEEINALQEFGKRTSRRKVSQDDAPTHSREQDESAESFQPVRTAKPAEKRRKPVSRKKVVPDEIINENEEKEIMVRQESGRGRTKFANTVRGEDYEKPAKKKFSKKINISPDKLPQFVTSERHDHHDVPGFMEIARRGSRQSKMEEMAHAHIHRLDVDCGGNGISVTLEFNEPFFGVVYSKGHFNDPRCT